MEHFRMVRIGDRIINISQITFAEYAPAFSPPPLEPAAAKNPNHHPITYARPEPSPSSLVVHFVGGESSQFIGDLADELNEHLDMMV